MGLLSLSHHRSQWCTVLHIFSMDPPIRRVHFYTKCIKAHLAGGSFAQSMLSYFVFTHWAMIVGMLSACYKGRPSAAQDCCTAEELRALYQPWPCQVHWVAPTVTPHFSLQGLAPKREEEMGLAGGIVRKVFSKSPCSSAGGRGHNVRAFSVSHSLSSHYSFLITQNSSLDRTDHS
jgi:hypothetical protein